MFDLTLIGIGTGNPDHLTLQAIKAINAAEVILIPRKGAGKADLAELRRAILAEVLTNPATKVIEFDLPVRDEAIADYLARVEDWHDRIAAVWAKAIGAPELVAHLRGDISLPEAITRAKLASRQYAKRQRTWFRSRMKAWHPLDPETLT